MQKDRRGGDNEWILALNVEGVALCQPRCWRDRREGGCGTPKSC